MRGNILTLSLVVSAASAASAFASGPYFNRALFLADAGTGPTNIVDFDSLPPLTDLTGQTLSGMSLLSPSGSPLQVINAAAGVRFSMNASSGGNVLSPGGHNPGLEDDDLTINFAVPVQAFGLDVVFDVPDGASYVGVTFRDVAGSVLFSDGFIPCPSGAPGFQFVGFVSSTANIASVTFDEFDGSSDDDNVAYDTLTVSVPTPGSMSLLALGCLCIRRRDR